MRRRKGGRKHRPAHKQNRRDKGVEDRQVTLEHHHHHTSPSTIFVPQSGREDSQAPSESSVSNSSEVDTPPQYQWTYDEGQLFAQETLAPSLSHTVLHFIYKIYTLFASLSSGHAQLSLLDWLNPLIWWGRMVLGLGSLWSTEKTEGSIELSDGVEKRGTRGKVVRRRRQRTVDGTVEVGREYFPGMVNLSGVLCYMNSVLQALASVTSLISHLEQITLLAVEADLPTPVTDALNDVLAGKSYLNTPHSSQPRPLRPHNLISALQPLPQIRRLLATREQQDAHELFVVLAEAISDEALKVAAEVLHLRGFADVLSLQAYSNNKNDRSPSPPISAISAGGTLVTHSLEKQKRKKVRGLAQPWEGLIARRRVCRRCGWKGEVRMDTLGGMELPVPLSGEVTLDSCIAEYLAPELLSGVNCEYCSVRETLDHYRSEVARLSVPPSKSHLNGHSQHSHTPSGSFSALENLPDPDASSQMSDRRKKKAKEARKVQDRLEQMVEAGSTAGYGDPTIPSDNTPDSVPLQVKWQKFNADSIRQTVITRPPRSLRLHVARSGFTPYGQMVKKSAKVSIPLILDMTRFTARGVWEERSDIRSLIAAGIKPTDTVPRVLYRLDSVILHYGYTTSSGHFICIRRKPVPVQVEGGVQYRPVQVNKSCPDGCMCEDCMYFGQVRENSLPGRGWLNISDDDVEEVGAEALVGASAAVFMLFYELVGDYQGPKKMAEAASTVPGEHHTGAEQ